MFASFRFAHTQSDARGRVDAPARAAAMLLASALALAACDTAGSPTADGLGGVTESEARAIDEAAKIRDEKRLPEGALPDIGAPANPAEGQPPSDAPTAR